ncbi:capsular exopolysaccharide synthesis family protein [Breznakibacter xylanolyticus]|uniref:non-specific protein-tyrosine kinase n=1 Tax=Breznakibacter xylanolyticus TaxID=990 RepID=A0A2W7MXD8_9BACT|nr:tyrosine-protein kinase [Breznakibacter xylanolyticus]PZX12321.1 capsular exopolysaccharide synthesis family protein [Breznakibacter xylanolyticus]
MTTPDQRIPPPSPSSPQDGMLSFKRLLGMAVRYWYFFAISIPIAMAAVWVYHHYTIPIYHAQATLLFKGTDERVMPTTNIIGGVGLSPEDRKIENQTFLLKSQRIARKTIDRLDYGIEYYAKGRVKDTEVYHTAPFEVVIDSLAPQLLDSEITIAFDDDDRIHLTIQAEGGRLYRYADHQVTGSSGAINFKTTLGWDVPLVTPFASFRIRKAGTGSFAGKSYYVVFRAHSDLASMYRGRLSVTNYREGSSIMFLGVTGPTPEKLRRYLDVLCQVVIEHNLMQKNDIADRSLHFIQKQLEMIADTLDRTQNLLLNFRKNHKITEPLNAGKQMASQYYELDKQRQSVALRSYYFNLLKKKLVEDPFSTDFMLPAFSDMNYDFVSTMVTELLTLNNEMAEFSAQANDTNPYLTALRGRIAVARDNLMVSIDKALESLAIEDRMLAGQMTGVDNRMDELPDIEKEYLRIERNYKLNDAIYTFLLQKNSETQITKASNSPDNEVVDQAVMGGIVSPNKRSNYTRALMLALAIPIGLILLIEFLNVRIRGTEDLTHLAPHLPVLGQIPHSRLDGQNVIVNSPNSNIAEAFRSIRTRLNFLSVDKPVKVIAITSTNTGDGKTFVSMNLASAYAVSGKKTIVLGFDLRRPKMTELFQLDNRAGISNFLIGQSALPDICYATSQPLLHVMPAGEVPPNPAELIGSSHTAELFEYLRKTYEVIVVDLPPVGVVSDGRLVFPFADALLYITRFNHTRKDHFQQTVRYLADEQIRSMGLLFNDVELPGQGYGSYYSDYYVKG